MTQTSKCPSCGASLDPASATRIAKCSFCGCALTIEEDRIADRSAPSTPRDVAGEQKVAVPSAGLRRLRTIFLVVAVLGALGDLASKSLAFSRLGSPPGKVEVIPGILRFECAWNPGVAWGMFSERSMRSAILALSVVAVPVIFFFFWRQKSPAWPNAVGLAGIAAGTLGNLHDRIRWGAVRDFIYVYCINFPVFNVADSMICVGAALFALEHVLVGRKKDEPVGVPEKAS